MPSRDPPCLRAENWSAAETSPGASVTAPPEIRRRARARAPTDGTEIADREGSGARAQGRQRHCSASRTIRAVTRLVMKADLCHDFDFRRSSEGPYLVGAHGSRRAFSQTLDIRRPLNLQTNVASPAELFRPRLLSLCLVHFRSPVNSSLPRFLIQLLAGPPSWALVGAESSPPR